jgi:hypothetical protein
MNECTQDCRRNENGDDFVMIDCLRFIKVLSNETRTSYTIGIRTLQNSILTMTLFLRQSAET